jgi:hypothetical protein
MTGNKRLAADMGKTRQITVMTGATVMTAASLLERLCHGQWELAKARRIRKKRR